MSKNLWWGYVHVKGTIQVKRFFNSEDLVEARSSPFVQLVMDPFEAEDREDALCIMELNLINLNSVSLGQS